MLIGLRIRKTLSHSVQIVLVSRKSTQTANQKKYFFLTVVIFKCNFLPLVLVLPTGSFDIFFEVFLLLTRVISKKSKVSQLVNHFYRSFFYHSDAFGCIWNRLLHCWNKIFNGGKRGRHTYPLVWYQGVFTLSVPLLCPLPSVTMKITTKEITCWPKVYYYCPKNTMWRLSKIAVYQICNLLNSENLLYVP